MLRRQGRHVGRKRVERLMRDASLQGAFLRKKWRIPSTRSNRCDTDLILGALEYGIWSRDVRDGQLIHHSDRGSNYTPFRLAQRPADNGILPSMGSVGDSYDNALMENFWSTLKIGLVYRNSWRTRDEAENAIFTYVGGWYNARRIQKDLGWRSPDEYETAWHTHQAQHDEATIVQPEPTGAR